MEQTNFMLMACTYLISTRQRREGQNDMLRWMYDGTSSDRQPGRMGRLLNRSLYVIGRLLVMVGERMQQSRKDMPAALPALK